MDIQILNSVIKYFRKQNNAIAMSKFVNQHLKYIRSYTQSLCLINFINSYVQSLQKSNTLGEK